MKRKLLSYLLALAMALSLLPTAALAENGVNCTAENCKHIAAVTKDEDTTHYASLAEALTAAAEGGTVKLLSNVTLTDDWTPIADFKGTLDGNSKTISGLSIKSGSTKIGLFASLDGEVKDLTIDGAEINLTGDTSRVGVLAGEAKYKKFTNVKITNATITSNAQYVGGLIGFGYGNVTDCEVSNSTITGKDQVGGLFGYHCLISVENCWLTKNTITATEERAGGIFGKLQVNVGDIGGENGTQVAVVTGCIVSGGSATAPDYAGGIAGQFMGSCRRYSITGNKVEKMTLNAPKAAAFATIADKQGEEFRGALKTGVTDNTFSTALNEAVEEAKTSGTFTLTAPITVPEEQSGMITVEEGTYVFELNNHKLTGGISNMGADVTIKDANIKTRYYDGASKQMVQYAAIAAYSGTTVVESGTFDSTNAVVQAQGGNVTLNAGTCILRSGLNPAPFGIYTVVHVLQQGSVTINGGTYKMAENKQGAPIAVESGTVTINNGTFTSNGHLSILAHPADAANKAVVTVNGGTFEGGIVADPGSEITINGGEFTSSGTILGNSIPVIEVYNDSDKGIDAGKVTINGGTFTGEVTAQEGATLTVTGGKFSVDPTAYIALGYITKINGDGTYTVVPNSGLTAGVYKGAVPKVASGYSYTNNDNGTYTVYKIYVAPSDTTTKTETVTNSDGSTTKTETKSDGSKVETTTSTDGTKTVVETKTTTDSRGTTTETTTETVTAKDGTKTETKTETATAKDGSKVETTTEKTTAADGTKTESEKKVETKTDGSEVKTEVKVETKTDGSKTEVTSEVKTAADGTTTGTEVAKVTDAAGSTGTTKTETNAAGETTVKAEASVSAKAVEEAKKAETPVTVPVEVKATTDTRSAPVVSVSVPKSAGEVKVEVPVTNTGSGTVAVLVHADGTEEIVKTCTNGENGVVLNVSGDVTVKIVDNSKDFKDTASHWSKDEVNFVASREIFNGVGNNDFGVSAPMTRGMVNTVLARLSGANTEGGANWYDKGNEWAKENGVSDGTNPTGDVTREQLATMLYRYAGSPEVTGTLGFTDAGSVSSYAQTALLWASQVGIIGGLGDGSVAPTAGAERAQVAAMLARYIKLVG